MQLHEQLKIYDEQAKYYDKEIREQAKNDPRCVAIQSIEGIGPITASALVATIGGVGLIIMGNITLLKWSQSFGISINH